MKGYALLGMVMWSVFAIGCGKRADVDKTLDCAAKQPYKSEQACKDCCKGDYKLKDEVCLCYK